MTKNQKLREIIRKWLKRKHVEKEELYKLTREQLEEEYLEAIACKLYWREKFEELNNPQL